MVVCDGQDDGVFFLSMLYFYKSSNNAHLLLFSSENKSGKEKRNTEIGAQNTLGYYCKAASSQY